MTIYQKFIDTLLIILALIALLWISQANAETGVSFTTVSHHFQTKEGNNSPKYNDLNLGIGVYWAGQDFGADLVTYVNSFSRNTIALTGSWEPLQWEYVQAGAFLGVASGYEHPYVGGGYLQVRVEKVAVRVIAIPKAGNTKNSATSLTLQGRVSF